MTLSFCIFQIVDDFKKYDSDSEIKITRSMRRDEMEDIEITMCYNHWLMWVSTETIQSYNLTKLEFLSLVTPFKSEFRLDIECSKQHDNDVNNSSALMKIGLKNYSWHQSNIIFKITQKIIKSYEDLYRTNTVPEIIKSAHIDFNTKNGILRLCTTNKFNYSLITLGPSDISIS